MKMNTSESKQMKILVVSDTHGNRGSMESALEQLGPINMILHLGDGVREGEEVALNHEIPYYAVRGNEDRTYKYPETELLDFYGWRVMLLHGHQYEINPYMPAAALNQVYDDIERRARKKGADVLFFGHTHKSEILNYPETFLCNPGDQYLGSSFPHQCIVMDISVGQMNLGIRECLDGSWENVKKQVKCIKKHEVVLF